MKITSAKEATRAAMKSSLPILLLGPPGVGKSTIPRELVVEEWGGEMDSNIIELRGSTCDASEVSDLKAIIDGKVVNAPQAWVPTNESVEGGIHPKNGIVFLDELLDSPLLIQSAFQQFVLDRRLGSVKLADGWYIMAASNRRNDGAAAGRLSTALASRFIIVEVEHDLEATIAYAYKKNWHPIVPAFLRFRPNLLTTFDQAKKSGEYSYACGRSWGMVSKILQNPLDPTIELEVLSGVVGKGPAGELLTFQRVYKSLPDLNIIRSMPATAPIPEEPSVLFATLGSLIGSLTVKEIDVIWPYITRISPEFITMFMRDAGNKLGSAMDRTIAWKEYAVNYGHYIM